MDKSTISDSLYKKDSSVDPKMSSFYEALSTNSPVKNAFSAFFKFVLACLINS